MSTLVEVGNYLESLGLGTVGTDLFLSRLMDVDTPAFAIGLFESAGQQGQRTHDIPGMALIAPGLDVLVRAATDQYAEAAARAMAIHEALVAIQNTTLSGVRYLAIDALSPPVDVGSDNHNRPIIEGRYLCLKDPTIHEGVTFAQPGDPYPYVTLSGLWVTFAAPGDTVPFRTLTGRAVYPGSPGDGFGTPYHT